MSRHPFSSGRILATAAFYPSLAWNSLLARCLKVRNWWDPIDPFVLVGAYPFASDVKRLYDAGVRAVVNTCEEYQGPVAEYKRMGIEQLQIPTTDFTPPRLEDVRVAVEFIQNHVVRGNMVYIHCKAGRGRSATIALCWLVKYRQMTAVEAQSYLLKSRPHVDRRLHQRSVVRLFAEELQNGLSAGHRSSAIRAV